MAGLLDFSSPEMRQAIGLLAAAGPSREPRSFGQRAQGLLQQLDAQQAEAEDRKQKRLLMAAQIGDLEAQALLRKAQAAKTGDRDGALSAILGGQSAPSQYGLGGGGMSLGGVREQMTPRAGGLEGATPEQIALLKAKYGVDIESIWRDAQRGHEVKPGTFYQKGNQRDYIGDPTKGIGMEGGRVSLMPGALDAQSALAGATKEAEARAGGKYSLVNGIDPATGAPSIVGTTTSIADRFNAPAQAPQQAPAVMDRIRAAMARNGDASANFDIGGVRGNIGGQQASGGGIKIGQSPQEKASTDAISLGNQSFMKDRYAPSLEAGDAASQTLAAVQSARQSLASMGRSGWGTTQLAGAGAVLGALGVPQAEKFAGNAQMFQSAAMGRLWTTLNAAKGPQTEGDADRASKTFASLQNTPRANEFILDMTQATAERERLKAQYFREALPMAQQSGDLQEIERRWSRLAPSIFDMPMMKRWAK